MDTLKKIFPVSFKYTDTTANLIIGILIYIVGAIIGGAVVGLVQWILSFIPVLVWLLSVVGSCISLYCVAGIVIQVLVFAKVLKD